MFALLSKYINIIKSKNEPSTELVENKKSKNQLPYQYDAINWAAHKVNLLTTSKNIL